jgi:hypothetical protein
MSWFYKIYKLTNIMRGGKKGCHGYGPKKTPASCGMTFYPIGKISTL